jgi:hypothetical protein
VTFIQRYLVDSFPYIAVIDPRTGAKIWVYQGPADAGEFLDKGEQLRALMYATALLTTFLLRVTQSPSS